MHYLHLLLPLGLLLPFTASAQEQHITHQGLVRQYIVYEPSAYAGQSATPVVFVLHGGGGSALVTQNFTRMNPVAEANGFLAVYPQGYTENSSGFVWADGRGTAADAADIDDVGFIDRLIDSLQLQYNIDTTRLYACGFSNGGFMTQRLACELNGRFAAMAGLGCSMDVSLFADCEPEAPVPMLYVAGTADPFVPYEGGFMNPNVAPIVPVDTAVQFWVRHNNCQTAAPTLSLPDLVQDDNSTVEQLDFTDCDCGAEVRFFRVLGGGHTWPGVENPAIEPLLGETNEDIQASEELWRFFEGFTNGCTPTAAPGLAAATDLTLRAFPNPFAETLVLDFGRALPAAASVRLYCLDGRAVLQRRIQAGVTQHRLPLPADLPAGVYLLRVLVNGRVLLAEVVRG